MRLNQYLAGAGLGSRRSCEELIRQNRVTINGRIVSELATRVSPGDRVTVDGRACKVEENLVLAFHKPRGYVCTVSDPEGRRTIYELLPKDLPRVVSVGRLDRESEGLLILTNDGELANRLTHPKHKVPKIYEVTLDKPFDFALAEKLLKGVNVEGKRARFESIHRVGPSTVKVVLTQGIKRQIRWMFLRVGYQVKRLLRTQIGELKLAEIPVGKARVLQPKEVLLLEKGELPPKSPKFQKTPKPPVVTGE